MMLRANRPPSHAENMLASLCSIRRPLTDDERADLVMFKKRVRDQQKRRERYANDPDFRRREIERNTRYWLEHR